MVLHDLVCRVETVIDHKMYAFGAFLDIEGAFDNTLFRAIKLAYHEKNVHL
jgi:hypothetical protein